MKNYFDIKDKVAVITGASSGLGWQIAQAYASQGAKLALFARREERLQENIAEIEKELNPKVKIIGVEPASSPLITKGVSGPHKLQTIGANFIPKIYDANVVDCVEAITNEDAITASRLFAQTEGILIGYTGGAALVCAIKVIKENPSFKNVVAILPDGGERYLSTDLYHDQQ